jgi:type I restriction enzyme R subunit
LDLAATPKRDQNADTYTYFGEPVYTYSLREGIEDGYAIRISLDELSAFGAGSDANRRHLPPSLVWKV